MRSQFATESFGRSFGEARALPGINPCHPRNPRLSLKDFMPRLRAATPLDKVAFMSKYKIAWMPGDGVGNDVIEAARIVLDRMKLDAEYVPCDIGWEFWCKEGNALPDRTVRTLKETTCGLFGGITSKPQSEAKEELSPELKGKGLVYFLS